MPIDGGERAAGLRALENTNRLGLRAAVPSIPAPGSAGLRSRSKAFLFNHSHVLPF